MTKEKPKRIELTVQEVEALIERIQQESLFKPDYGLLVAIVINYFTLDQAHQEQSHTLLRLVNQIFGHRTEKAKEVLKGASPEKHPRTHRAQLETASPKEKPKGHGRNGASAYEGAQKVCVPHSCYKAGDRCPLCPKGKLYPFWMSQGSRCALWAERPWKPPSMNWRSCAVTSAARSLPPRFPKKQERTNTMRPPAPWWPFLKYGSGLPFNRLEKLQESLGVPLPASTQWEMAETERR